MAAHPDVSRKDDLKQIARRAMQQYGFLPDFSADALREWETVPQVNREAESLGIDLHQLLWASIDNDDSLDPDQLTVAKALTAAKSAAALLLSSRIGDRFEAICTGAADKGTWVRIFQPPIEGRLLYGVEGVDVGHRLKVQLIHTDVEKGYIDFKKVQ
jgi:hypothetical protein